jgi:hypothetical protein
VRAHDPYNELVITEQRYAELLEAEHQLAEQDYKATRALELGGDAIFRTADGLEAVARVGPNYVLGGEYARPIRHDIAVVIADAECDTLEPLPIRRYRHVGRRGKFPLFQEIA